MPGSASSPADPGAWTPAPRRALVMGATGVVGRFLLPRLVAAEWHVDALSRGAAPPWRPAGVRWNVLDVGGGLAPLRTHAVVVFHAAPLWLLPPLVPQLAALGLRRVVAFGSTSRFTKQDSRAEAARALATRLARAEDELAGACAAHGLAWTVFRPTLVYGAGQDGNVSSMARLIRRFGVFPLGGKGSGLRQPVHADDLAAACLLAVNVPATFGRAYDLTGGSTLSYRDMVAALFSALGRRPRFLRLPVPLLRAALAAASRLPSLRHLGPDMAERMNVDQAFDCAEARRDFGYAPRPFDAAAVVAGIG